MSDQIRQSINQRKRQRRITSDGDDADNAHDQLQRGYEQLVASLDRVLMLREPLNHELLNDKDSVRERESSSGPFETEHRVLEKCIALAKSIGAQLQQSGERPTDSTAHLLDWMESSPFSSSTAPLVLMTSLHQRALDGNDNGARKERLHLPQHIVMNIVQFLPVSSLVSCTMVNKTFARACFARGSIRHALVFDRMKGWSDTTFFHFVRDMLRDDPRKLDLVNAVQFTPFYDDEMHEIDATPTVFPALQFVRQGEHQNTNITELTWKGEIDHDFNEQEVRDLQSIYPNLTGIHIDRFISIPALRNYFPQLQYLSVLAISNGDIFSRRKPQPIPSLQKLTVMDYESDLNLHYICYMFPNLVELSMEEVHVYNSQTELIISEFPSAEKRLLKDLPVPPLKKLAIQGIALEDDDIFDDFIFRFDQLESISLTVQSTASGPSDIARLHTIIRNNQSLTELETDRVIDASIFQSLYANRDILRKFVGTRIATMGDIIPVADLKQLQHLDLRIENKDEGYRAPSHDRILARRAIESLIELVDLSIPSPLGIDFECLPKLRRLELTGRTAFINIRSSSLDQLDLGSSLISFAKITCRNLTSFTVSDKLVILQLDTPRLEIIQSQVIHLRNTIRLSIRSHALSSLTLSTFVNIESYNLDTPMLRRLKLSWKMLRTILSGNGDDDLSDTVSHLPLGLQNVCELVIENSDPIAVDETFSNIISSFPHLNNLQFFNCGFTSDEIDEIAAIAPVPTVTRFELCLSQDFGPLAKNMGRLFPNVQRFSLTRWICETLPEDDLVECITEAWNSLADLCIEIGTSHPPSKFTNGAVQTIFDRLLKKGVIRRLCVVLGSMDHDGNRYSAELSHCSSLRELVANVNIIFPTSQDDDEVDHVTMLPNMRYVNITHFNGMTHMSNEQDSRTFAKCLSRTCPQIETLDLVMLFFRRENVTSMMVHFLDELVPLATKLKCVKYNSSSSMLFEEFAMMRQRYPQLDISIQDWPQFHDHKMIRNVFDDEDDQ